MRRQPGLVVDAGRGQYFLVATMRKYRDYLIERLSDREEAGAYLQTALEEYQADGDMATFMLALRSVV